jgi:hypothetical protein
VFGSPAAPVIMVVYGDLDLMGDAIGYGVLFVDGSFRMLGGSRWEGLVFVRPGGDKIDLSGFSEIFGAVVGLTGPNANPVLDQGLLGGHIDVDVFAGATSRATHHEHQYDDELNLSSLNLTVAGCGGAGLCWDTIVGTGYPEVRVEFLNPASSSGVFEFQAGDSLYTGLTTDGFTHTFNPAALTTFNLSFNSLCDLRGTIHRSVQRDVTLRDNAFAVRVFDVSTGNRIYELVVYHHDRDEECATDPTDEDQQPLQFEIGGDAAIYYSSAAIMRLNSLIPAINLGETRIENIQEITAY